MEKAKMTRPQFLMKFFTDDEINEKELQKMFPENYGKIYCCYNMIMNSPFSPDDILAGTVDAESGTIALHMRKSKFGKQLKEQYHRSIQTVGKMSYQTKIKLRGDFIIFNMSAQGDDEEDLVEEDE